MPFLVVDVYRRKESSLEHNMNLYLNARRQHNLTKNSQCCPQWQIGPKPSATFPFQSTFPNIWYSPKEFQRFLSPPHHITLLRDRHATTVNLLFINTPTTSAGCYKLQHPTTTEKLWIVATHQIRLRPQTSKNKQQPLRVRQSVHWSNRKSIKPRMKQNSAIFDHTNRRSLRWRNTTKTSPTGSYSVTP
jgi:hypothetical protein